jgi:hypothetical protein
MANLYIKKSDLVQEVPGSTNTRFNIQRMA